MIPLTTHSHECLLLLLQGMRGGWVVLLFSPNSILKPVIGYRSSLYAAVVPSCFLASVKLNKTQVLNTFYALEYQMFFAISRNGALLIFIIASYENVSSIHIPYSRCLTWVHCMKSQSCVQKFNIFSLFTAVQWISYRVMFVSWFKNIISFFCPIYFVFIWGEAGILGLNKLYHSSGFITLSRRKKCGVREGNKKSIFEIMPASGKKHFCW